ncbi:hypothetical protein ZIOFF_052703 [Zingiber officinale]|uniref:60S ribosomal protein L41 n=1 Tax=Zingiber officinale TaxID=94328 RepID=A0A8J5FPM3_ZINOF|nr:hypothetical protein ZIOFF_052703 [Zingiber officinale]
MRAKWKKKRMRRLKRKRRKMRQRSNLKQNEDLVAVELRHIEHLSTESNGVPLEEGEGKRELVAMDLFGSGGAFQGSAEVDLEFRVPDGWERPREGVVHPADSPITPPSPLASLDSSAKRRLKGNLESEASPEIIGCSACLLYVLVSPAAT